MTMARVPIPGSFHFAMLLLHIPNSVLKAGVHIVCLHAGLLFTLDIFLLFHTGFIITCNLRKRLIMDGYFVARYYAKHASLLVDVLATVPSWIEVSLSARLQAAWFSIPAVIPCSFPCVLTRCMVEEYMHTKLHVVRQVLCSDKVHESMHTKLHVI